MDEKTKIAAKAIAFALYSLHPKEKTGENDGEIIEKLLEQAGGRKGMPWCVAFIDFIYDTTNSFLGLKKKIDVGLSTGELFRKAKRLEMVVESPQACDVCLVNNLAHTTMVWTDPDAAGNFWTIEGNSSNTVKKVKRHVGDDCKFVRLW